MRQTQIGGRGTSRCAGKVGAGRWRGNSQMSGCMGIIEIPKLDKWVVVIIVPVVYDVVGDNVIDVEWGFKRGKADFCGLIAMGAERWSGRWVFGF
ncbi:hypothetical protein ACFX2I_047009 [Malus domestica]